jgi:tetratricopeptide (TPR) repeat protein
MSRQRAIADLEMVLRAGLAAQAAGDLERAAACYGRALAIHPRCADALHLLGQVRHQRGAHAEALALVRRAIAAAPPTAMYANTTGVILRALDRRAEALVAFRRAATLDPRHAAARKNLAVEMALAEVGSEEVVAAFVAAAALDPSDPECWIGLSHALMRAERAGEAVTAAERAVGLDPGRAAALEAWFAAAAKAERLADFVDKTRVDVPGAPPERGLRRVDALLTLDRGAEARDAARVIAARAPEDPRSWERLGAAEQAMDANDAAAACFERALELCPSAEIGAGGLATCRMNAGRLEEALAIATAALVRRPGSHSLLNNQGVILCRMDRDAEAIACFDRAVELSDDRGRIRFNRAMSLLRLWRLGAAWDDYRWRESATKPIPVERWPLDLGGRRIHVKAEQGIGDHLFFLRFVPAIVARGAVVTVDVDDRLGPMIARSGFAFAAAAPEGSEIVGMGHMPWLLGHGDADIPPPIALAVPDERMRRAAALLEGLPRPVVCATWRAGGQKGRKDTTKIVPADALGAALRGLPGSVVSVQRKPLPGEHAAFERGLGRPAADLSAANDDLEDMLALMAIADAYAGVSNANLHLRCGTGAGSDILATFPLDWRWPVDANGQPAWYPGCSVHSQGIHGQWDAALETLSAAVARRLT